MTVGIIGTWKRKLSLVLVAAAALVAVCSSVSVAIPHVFTVSEPELVGAYALVFDPGRVGLSSDNVTGRRKPSLLAATAGPGLTWSAATRSHWSGERVVELNLRGHTRVVAGPGALGEAGNIRRLSKTGFSIFADGDLLVVGGYVNHPYNGVFRVNRNTGQVQVLLHVENEYRIISAAVDPTESNSFYIAERGRIPNCPHRILKARITEEGDLDVTPVVGGGTAQPGDVARSGTEINIPNVSFSLSVDHSGKVLVATSGRERYVDNWVAELDQTGQVTLVQQYPWINHVASVYPVSAVRLPNGSIAVSIFDSRRLGTGIELLKHVRTDQGLALPNEWLVNPTSTSDGNGILVNQLQLLGGDHSPLSATPDGGLFASNVVNCQTVMRYIEPIDRTDEQRAQLAQLNPERAADKLIRTRKAVLSLAKDHWVQGTPLQRVPREVRQIIVDNTLNDHHEQWWQTLMARWIPPGTSS